MEINLENYHQEKRTIDLVKANVYALLILIPIVLLYGLPFYFLWHQDASFTEFANSLKASGTTGIFSSLFKMIAIALLGIVVHELIHGITWMLAGKKSYKTISFGVLWKAMAPYCHCNEPMKVKPYLIGAIMPAILLGFLPAIYAIATNNVGLLLFAGYFTMAAIGDFMVIQLLLKEDMDSLVLDHPSEAGCYIYRKNHAQNSSLPA